MKARALVVRRHRPWKDFLEALVAVVLFAAAGWLAYQAGRAVLVPKFDAARAANERLLIANQRLVAANARLEERVAILERSMQIGAKAQDDVRVHLTGLQEEILDLKEEVAFYRSIAESGRPRGLAIQSFNVRHDSDEDDAYRYRLVLTGDMKNDKVISGTVNFFVAGEQRGRLRQLSLAEVSDASSREISFQLKYFQKLKGRLRLPEDFIPHRVFVQVTASGETPSTIERTFDWPTPVG